MAKDYLIEEEIRRGYFTSAVDRKAVDSVIGKVTLESLCADLNKAAERALCALQFIVKSIDRSGETVGDHLVLDTHIAEEFYWYAMEGVPRFAMTYEKGQLVDLPNDPNDPQCKFWSGDHLADGMVDYWQLFRAFEETAGFEDVPPSLSLVEETFYCRLALDHYRITGEVGYMSGRDLALLANMKPRSAYNVVPREIPEEKLARSSTGYLLIATDAAESWLVQRRRYKPSKLPESGTSRDRIVQFYNDRAG